MANEAASNVIKGYVDRAEQLQRRRELVDEDLSDLFAEAKRNGLDVKVLKEALKVRGQDKAARAEHGALLQLYLDAAEAA